MSDSRRELLIHFDGVSVFAALDETDADEVLDDCKGGDGKAFRGFEGISVKEGLFVGCEWKREELSKWTRPGFGCQKVDRS